MIDPVAVDTLEYLRRGGRIGAAQAFLGSALKIKPILSIDSEITPVERVRTQGRAIDRLVRELPEQREAGAGRLLHPARAGAGARRADRRARPRDLRPRAGVHLGDRARHRHPHRARPRGRDEPSRRACSAPCGGAGGLRAHAANPLG